MMRGEEPSPAHRCAIATLQGARPAAILVIGAHPDDETIGIGATLGGLIASGWRARVLHVTDGAPHDEALRYALRHRTREEASAIRHAEIRDALRAGGMNPEAIVLPSLPIADQEASLAMADVARALADRIAESGADVVVTHPYEGGHPDHDATAFAVHAATALLASRGGSGAALAEMTSYHTRDGSLVTAAFRANAGEPVCHAHHDGRLDDDARARKRRMLDAFPTQAEILEPFGIDAEPLRCAPHYDFTRPPHEGKLHYESLPFGWTGARWRELARQALADLGLGA